MDKDGTRLPGQATCHPPGPPGPERSQGLAPPRSLLPPCAGSVPAARPPEPAQALANGPEQQEPHHRTRQPLERWPGSQQPYTPGDDRHDDRPAPPAGSGQSAQ